MRGKGVAPPVPGEIGRREDVSGFLKQSLAFFFLKPGADMIQDQMVHPGFFGDGGGLRASGVKIFAGQIFLIPAVSCLMNQQIAPVCQDAGFGSVPGVSKNRQGSSFFRGADIIFPF